MNVGSFPAGRSGIGRDAGAVPPSSRPVRQPGMVNTRNDLAEKTRITVCTLLNARLADAIDLWLQAKQAHWNVRGPHFIALHELFDMVAKEVEGTVDLTGERVVQLGGLAHGTLKAAAQNSSLKDYPLETVEGHDHLQALSLGLSQFVANVRQDIDTCAGLEDAGTVDLLTDVCRETEKYLWFVEAHLRPNG